MSAVRARITHVPVPAEGGRISPGFGRHCPASALQVGLHSAHHGQQLLKHLVDIPSPTAQHSTHMPFYCMPPILAQHAGGCDCHHTHRVKFATYAIGIMTYCMDMMPMPSPPEQPEPPQVGLPVSWLSSWDHRRLHHVPGSRPPPPHGA